MNDGKTFRESLREERDKLKAMNFTEKRQHIWEYYKAHMIFLAVVIFLLYSIVGHIVNPPKRDYLYIAWLGATVDVQRLADLGDALQPIVYDPERQRVTVGSYTAHPDPQMNAAIQTRFAGMIQTGSIDIILTSCVGVEELDSIQLLRNISETPVAFRFAHYARAIPERIRVCPQDGRWLGISLQGSSLLTEVGINSNDLYLTVLGNTQRFYEINQALEALLR
ncbi:MAG: hypothetical protein FWC16_11570 [Defluviitaleaceae bacterium]|nr:hypothetical protein [Defluviitaleaceae bacterium]MCL2275557.1 hypothetical protein [Defluviitaleaceae bacterium]